MEEIKTLVPEKMSLNIKRNKEKHFITFSDYQDFDARQKNTDSDFSLQYSCTSEKFPHETYMKELRLVCSGKVVATSGKFNTKYAEWYSFNLEITEHQNLRKVVPKSQDFIEYEETRISKRR